MLNNSGFTQMIGSPSIKKSSHRRLCGRLLSHHHSLGTKTPAQATVAAGHGPNASRAGRESGESGRRGDFTRRNGDFTSRNLDSTIRNWNATMKKRDLEFNHDIEARNWSDFPTCPIRDLSMGV
jgi:hypothetical protein